MFGIFGCRNLIKWFVKFDIVVGDAANIILDPIFIFILRMGVTGAAVAHVISQ